jgi:hypothetical protein
MVAGSSVEVEFRAMSQGICEGTWILKVLRELKIAVELPFKLYCDSKVTTSTTHNLVQHDRAKYIEINHHFFKEKIDYGILC